MLMVFNVFFWIVNIDKKDIKPWYYSIQSVVPVRAKSNNYGSGLPQTLETLDNFYFSLLSGCFKLSRIVCIKKNRIAKLLWNSLRLIFWSLQLKTSKIKKKMLDNFKSKITYISN